MKHTPAPWYQMGTHLNNEKVVISTGWQNQIASINFVIDQETSEANAQLIAAAPELLEALENLIELTESYHCQIFGSYGLAVTTDSGNNEHPLNKSKSIIAKAKGL